MSGLTRRQFAELVSERINRPNLLIDFGLIVIWKDANGLLNQATTFKYSKSADKDTSVIHIHQFHPELIGEGKQMVWLSVFDRELYNFTSWIANWNEHQERGEEYTKGVVSLVLPEFGIDGSSQAVHTFRNGVAS